MKTRIIQSLPAEPAESTKTVAETGTDVPRSNNLAARMGRWSASHWKTAIVRLARVRSRRIRSRHRRSDADDRAEGRRRRRGRQGQ